MLGMRQSWCLLTAAICAAEQLLHWALMAWVGKKSFKHYSFCTSLSPLWNTWCSLKGRAISLSGVKNFSPSEMPHSLSIYNTSGCSKSCQEEKVPEPCTATARGRRKLCSGDLKAEEISGNPHPQPCQNPIA